MAVYEQLVDYKQEDLYPYIGAKSFAKIVVGGTDDTSKDSDTAFFNFFSRFFDNSFKLDNASTKIGIDSSGKDDKGARISYTYPYGIKINNTTATSSSNPLEISLQYLSNTPEGDETPRNDSDTKIQILKVPQAISADRSTTADSATTAQKPAGNALTTNGFIYINNSGNFVTVSPQYSGADSAGSIFGFSETGSPMQFNVKRDENGNVSLGGGGGVTANKADAAQIYYLLGTASKDAGELNTVIIANDSPYFRSGNLYQSSDESLKTFTEDLDINLDDLATIKKGLFYWNTDETKTLDLGVTAQSVEALYPELVSENDGVKAVTYSKLGVIALAAIDKLNAKIKELESEIADLKSKI